MKITFGRFAIAYGEKIAIAVYSIIFGRVVDAGRAGGRQFVANFERLADSSDDFHGLTLRETRETDPKEKL